MKKLDRKKLRMLILKELRHMQMANEDALMPPPQVGDPHYVDYIENEPCPDCGDHHAPGDCEMRVAFISEECGCGGNKTDYSLETMADMPHHDASSGIKNKKHRRSYMAKPQLSKIARYAQSLHDMIGDNEQLDDWQESHIAQLADDIGEVYHSIDYKKNYKH